MGDYEVESLSNAMNKQELVADIVSTWLERGENRPTICFCVNRLHAQFVQKQFQEAGVKCEYQDAFTTREERADIAKRFENGDVQIVCNVGTLTTGVDWDVRCIILARPTKGEMLYVQMIGRGLRTAKGKDHLVVLDHSDTTTRLGFVSDIHHNRLSVGQKDVLEKEARQEPLPKECPQCHFLRPPRVSVCPSCGFQAVAVNKVHSVAGELQELSRNGAAAKLVYSPVEKELFYRELVTYGRLRDYKSGWAWFSYRDKFGEKPGDHFSHKNVDEIRPGTASWIKHRLIATAKARQKFQSKNKAVGA
jgi:superfamily II DNA or RNA helicase